MLEFISNNDKIQQCTLATNCVIIPNQKILDVLKNNKFNVRISSYGTTNELSIDKLINVLENNNISYSFHSYVSGNGTWYDKGGVDMKRSSKRAAQEAFANCFYGKHCFTLENGKIFCCSRGAHAHNAQGYKPKRSDFVNVRTAFFAIRNLIWYINRCKHGRGGDEIQACYYCTGVNGREIPAGEQFTVEEYKEIKRKYYDR